MGSFPQDNDFSYYVSLIKKLCLTALAKSDLLGHFSQLFWEDQYQDQDLDQAITLPHHQILQILVYTAIFGWSSVQCRAVN